METNILLKRDKGLWTPHFWKTLDSWTSCFVGLVHAQFCSFQALPRDHIICHASVPNRNSVCERSEVVVGLDWLQLRQLLWHHQEQVACGHSRRGGHHQLHCRGWPSSAALHQGEVQGKAGSSTRSGQWTTGNLWMVCMEFINWVAGFSVVEASNLSLSMFGYYY